MGRLWLDDEFATHPKLLALGTRDKRWTWLEVLVYTCKHASPVVPDGIRDVVAKATPSFLEACMTVGLIDLDDDGTMVVHDWHEYQGTVDERVAAYLNRHPDASANEVQQAIAGKREAVLAAVKRFREQFPTGSQGGTREPPKLVPTGSGLEKDLKAVPVASSDGNGLKTNLDIRDTIDRSLGGAA